ncbi:hypothetical protein Hanom_Chr03g00274291 [Helianthus anomalus]
MPCRKRLEAPVVYHSDFIFWSIKVLIAAHHINFLRIRIFEAILAKTLTVTVESP